MLAPLAETGFAVDPVRGAYYVMADVSHLDMGDDVEVANRLTKDVGVAVVPRLVVLLPSRAQTAPRAVRVL